MLSSIMYYYDKKLNSKFTTYVRDLAIITALVVFDRYLKYATRMLRVVLRNTDGTVARQFPHLCQRNRCYPVLYELLSSVFVLKETYK